MGGVGVLKSLRLESVNVPFEMRAPNIDLGNNSLQHVGNDEGQAQVGITKLISKFERIFLEILPWSNLVPCGRD
jgi:hypothetical protein